MGLLRAHVAAVSIVVFGLTVVAAVFTFARPTYRPDTLPKAPTDLPYTQAAYTPARTQVAFALHGVRLIRHSDESSMTDFSDRDLRIEVTVFGDPVAVKAFGGSFDYVLDADNHWVHYPRTCTGGMRDAALWRENVRAVVRCGVDDAQLLQRVTRALASLPPHT